MIVLALFRWLLLLAALVVFGVLLDRLLIWLDRQGAVRYRAGRQDRDRHGSKVRSATERFRRRSSPDRAPEGFPDDPFPTIDVEDEEEDRGEEPPDNVYPFH